VVGLDSFDSYYDPVRKRANVEEVREGLVDASQLDLVEGDIRDRELLARLFSEKGPETVIHLAAMPGVRASIDRPHLYYDVNLNGTLCLLEAARAHGKPHFVFASTSSAYGATDATTFEEALPADRPLAPYPASKRAAEMLGHAYHHAHGQSFTALRFFTVYGPRNRPDMMALKLLDNVFRGRRVELYDRGKLHRDWTFGEDSVQGIVAASHTPLGYCVMNLGRGEPVLLSDFVACVEKVTGRKTQLEPAPMNRADVPYTCASIARARESLGYDPQTSVAQGVEKLVEWYRRAELRE
jgi:UDP-glucuronate 4-epimerase